MDYHSTTKRTCSLGPQKHGAGSQGTHSSLRVSANSKCAEQANLQGQGREKGWGWESHQPSNLGHPPRLPLLTSRGTSSSQPGAQHFIVCRPLSGVGTQHPTTVRHQNGQSWVGGGMKEWVSLAFRGPY